MSIHQRIKQRREELGLTMQGLAERVDVRAWQTIQQWEKEDGGTAPKRERLAKVAVALETTPEYLLFGATQGVGEGMQEPPPRPLPTKTKWSGLPEASLDVVLQDWRKEASPKSREVIDNLIDKASRNAFTEDQWEVFLWLAEKYSQKNQ